MKTRTQYRSLPPYRGWRLYRYRDEIAGDTRYSATRHGVGLSGFLSEDDLREAIHARSKLELHWANLP